MGHVVTVETCRLKAYFKRFTKGQNVLNELHLFFLDNNSRNAQHLCLLRLWIRESSSEALSVFNNRSIMTQFEFRFKQTHCAHAIIRLLPRSEQYDVFEKLYCKCKEQKCERRRTRGTDFRRLFQLDSDQIFSLVLFVRRDEAELMSYRYYMMERHV